MKYQGLGRGLDSLIPPKNNKAGFSPEKNQEKTDKKEILEISISLIVPNPMQPRRDFNHQDLEDLINSIREYGIIQPLVVNRAGDKYQLIAGERRFRAAQFLSLEKVPAVIREARLSDGQAQKQEMLELALIENIQRKDLNPMEKAKGYLQLMAEFNFTQEQVAQKMGKNRATVANTLRLLDLPREIQRALEENKISEGHAKLILSVPLAEQQLKIFQKILENNFSVRETESQIKNVKVKSYLRSGIKDVSIGEKEEKLREALGTKTIIKKRGKKGKIIIEFYSDEELAGIIDKICA